jgi:LAS superfamily LD-carboxypeptidase LdcB
VRVPLRDHWLHVVAILLGIFVVAGSGYAYLSLRGENEFLSAERNALEGSVNIAVENLRRSEQEKSDLAEALRQEQDANTNLSTTLQAEQEKNSLFESQIRDISGTVGTLTKLSQTDPELLMKYSKVYFLSENYIPAHLTPLADRYVLNPDRPEQVQTETLPFLTRMLTEAEASVGPLRVASAYRSFGEQAAVKSGYKFLYGSGANSFSADQGYSEHQLGTTVDLTTPTLAGLSLKFKDDPAYAWLTANAFRFGFILSYPSDNAYYQFEPWHWRFVGVALATTLHASGKRFYDLTQREIDGYLITLFDQ